MSSTNGTHVDLRQGAKLGKVRPCVSFEALRKIFLHRGVGHSSNHWVRSGAHAKTQRSELRFLCGFAPLREIFFFGVTS